MNNFSTICGLLAILFWSSSVAIIKSLSPKVGSVFPTVCVFLIGGLFLALYEYISKRKLGFQSFSKKYHLICGSLFVVNMIVFYTAIGIAKSELSAIGIGLVNYTWPSMTLIFSIPILGKKAKPSLVLGIIFATIGVFLAANTSNQISLSDFSNSIKVDYLAYTLAAIASITWGLYCNYSTKLGKGITENSVSLYMFLTGLFALIYFLSNERIPEINTKTALELTILMTTNTIAYVFWDIGTRKGNLIIVSSFAYLTPLLSTLCTCWYLGLIVGIKILTACTLIIIGAFICSKSVN